MCVCSVGRCSDEIIPTSLLTPRLPPHRSRVRLSCDWTDLPASPQRRRFGRSVGRHNVSSDGVGSRRGVVLFRSVAARPLCFSTFRGLEKGVEKNGGNKWICCLWSRRELFAPVSDRGGRGNDDRGVGCGAVWCGRLVWWGQNCGFVRPVSPTNRECACSERAHAR